MSSQEYEAVHLDDLFRQALRPYAEVKASNNIWMRIKWRIETETPGRWQRMLAWFSRPFTFNLPVSHSPFYLEPNQYRPSPFLVAMARHMLDVRFAS